MRVLLSGDYRSRPIRNVLLHRQFLRYGQNVQIHRKSTDSLPVQRHHPKRNPRRHRRVDRSSQNHAPASPSTRPTSTLPLVTLWILVTQPTRSLRSRSAGVDAGGIPLRRPRESLRPGGGPPGPPPAVAAGRSPVCMAGFARVASLPAGSGPRLLAADLFSSPAAAAASRGPGVAASRRERPARAAPPLVCICGSRESGGRSAGLPARCARIASAGVWNGGAAPRASIFTAMWRSAARPAASLCCGGCAAASVSGCARRHAHAPRA